jgi:hypothetical protein
VWALVGDPRRWPEIEPATHRVWGAPDTVSVGQRLLVIVRRLGVGIPVDVVAVEPRRRLRLVIHLLPGVHEQLDIAIEPAATPAGVGSRVRLVSRLEGPLAPAMLPSLWAERLLTLRLLLRRARSVGPRVGVA